MEQGAVDGGFVYFTDAVLNDKLKVKEKYSVIGNEKIIYPVAITKSCRDKVAAAKFISFITSKKAANVFRKYGFTTK